MEKTSSVAQITQSESYSKEDVIFEPNPGPQTSFLSSTEQEVLYGGSAGGGKSYSLIADPVRYFSNPSARMLLVRRSTEELRELISVSKKNKIALVFGNETNGLSNSEIEHCQSLGFIDANSDYSSLNLSQAVQIVCHEIRMMSTLPSKNHILKRSNTDYVSHEVQNGFYIHLEQMLNQLGFLKKIQAERLMRRLKLLFNRIKMEKDEVNILRGILSEIQKKIK